MGVVRWWVSGWIGGEWLKGKWMVRRLVGGLVVFRFNNHYWATGFLFGKFTLLGGII